MKRGMAMGLVAAASVAMGGVAAAQGARSVYSDRAMSADELEAAFGLGRKPPTSATRSLGPRSPLQTRSIAVEIGGDGGGAPSEPQRAESAASISMPIQFSLGSDAVDPRSRESLRGLAELMQRYDQLILLVIGHTDSRGAPLANQLLSERRALAVRQALVGFGVPATQIAAMGQGAASPLAGEPAASDRQRRVEFIPVKRN